jgi:hypothetical protein
MWKYINATLVACSDRELHAAAASPVARVLLTIVALAAMAVILVLSLAVTGCG